MAERGILDQLEQAVLRVGEEPCRYHREADIHRALLADPDAYIGFVRAVLLALASGEAEMELPPKVLFTDSAGGDFRVMPAVVRWGTESCSVVKVVGTNCRQQLVPDQITVGRAVALEQGEHFVSDLFEICLLSSIRTGLCAALAAELLAPESRQLVVYGAGRVGYYSALLVGRVVPIETLTVIDPVPGRAAACAALLKRQLPEVSLVALTAADPAPPADIVVLATDSRAAFCQPRESAGQLVISLGADCDEQSELGDGWPSQAEIFVDLSDSARFGDLKRWLQQGRIERGQLTDMMTLLRSGSPRAGGQKLFVSTGSALFDNLTIAYLLGRWRGAFSQFR